MAERVDDTFDNSERTVLIRKLAIILLGLAFRGSTREALR